MSTAYDYQRYSILYVDDEEQSLKYFERAMSKQFRVLTATDVASARKVIDEVNDLAVVVTDQRMPGETGVDLLSELRRTRPAVIRMLTTAYSDIESAIDAVNSGAIYKYIVKPWNLRDVQGTLMRAMEFFIIQRERDQLLGEKIETLQRLFFADRVRGLTFMAAGLSHTFRNSLQAVSTFVDQAPLHVRDVDADAVDRNPAFWQDMWEVARQETHHLLGEVERVSELVLQPKYELQEDIDLRALIDLARDEVLRDHPRANDASLVVRIEGDLPTITADPNMLRRLVRILFSTALDQQKAADEPAVTLLAKPGDGEVLLQVHSEGERWADDQIEHLFQAIRPMPEQSNDDPTNMGQTSTSPTDRLLAAFFIAHHHGGNLLVHAAPPHGPGFDVRLPVAEKPQSSANGLYPHRPDAVAALLDGLFRRTESALF